MGYISRKTFSHYGKSLVLQERLECGDISSCKNFQLSSLSVFNSKWYRLRWISSQIIGRLCRLTQFLTPIFTLILNDSKQKIVNNWKSDIYTPKFPQIYTISTTSPTIKQTLTRSKIVFLYCRVSYRFVLFFAFCHRSVKRRMRGSCVLYARFCAKPLF